MNAQRILLIDDSEIVLDRVKGRLSAEGYEVVTTSQTVGAARYTKNCDVVIIDFHMPGIDGRAVLDSLRAAHKNAAAGPLFYLYTSDEEKAGEHKKLGFDGAIVKKGDDDALVQQVAAIFRLVRLRRISNRSP